MLKAILVSLLLLLLLRTLVIELSEVSDPLTNDIISYLCRFRTFSLTLVTFYVSFLHRAVVHNL